MRDEHGQPTNLYLNATHRQDRAVHELLGLIRGVLVDGIVAATEVLALDLFFDRHPDLVGSFPGEVLYRRIRSVMADGVIEQHELDDLRGLLADTIGEHAGVHDLGAQAATQLPLTIPAPSLKFEGSVYVVTGRFMFGARDAVEGAISTRGGLCDKDVTRRTDVLLIGTLASRDWKHSSFGRKIQKASEYSKSGRAIAVVAEDHWVTQLRA